MGLMEVGRLLLRRLTSSELKAFFLMIERVAVLLLEWLGSE